jgi:hypothetical protein
LTSELEIQNEKTRDDKNRDKKSLSIFYFKIENNVEI